jgi:hypothetical protein
LRIFLDTSALVKVYIDEPGSERVLEILAETTAVVLSVLAEPELISSMNRLHREKKMTDAQYRAIKQELTDDLKTFEIVEIDAGVVETAVELLESSPLRASDALHVASAKKSDVDLLLTSDRVQYSAARHSGLKVLNPANE